MRSTSTSVPRGAIKSFAAAAALLTAAVDPVLAQASREHINIVGSSTVYPFSTVVAERFGRKSDFRTPKVESTGSGGGIKLFCAGIGLEHPDIANSSRRIKASEVAQCEENGVGSIVEVKIGYDGIVLAGSMEGPDMNLSRREVFLALAKEVPDANGNLIANPYEVWSDIRADLPSHEISVLGPPPTSGTRDAFVELAMEEGCLTFESIEALKSADKDRFKEVCHSLREDGSFVEAGENDNLIVQKLTASPNQLGIFGYSFLDQNYDLVKGAFIDGQEPEFDAIANGDYPLSRPLFFYVKKAHVDVVPGLREFLLEFTSESAWGDDGYLSERGLIPMPTQERTALAAAINALKELTLASL